MNRNSMNPTTKKRIVAPAYIQKPPEPRLSVNRSETVSGKQKQKSPFPVPSKSPATTTGGPSDFPKKILTTVKMPLRSSEVEKLKKQIVELNRTFQGLKRVNLQLKLENENTTRRLTETEKEIQEVQSKIAALPKPEEEKIVKDYEKIEELAENLNCDYTDPNELQSLQVALQLQAEEMERAKRENLAHLARVVQYLPYGEYESEGYTEAEINTLPVKPYEEKESEEECALCHEVLQEGESVKVLKCHHEYHEECADEWLLHHRICPLCSEPAI